MTSRARKTAGLTLLTLSLAALLAASAATASPQDERRSERRVMVWRGQGDEAIDLEAIHGHRGFLGVRLLDLTPELRAHFGVPEDRGIMVSAVVADSPAQRAGLQPADILTAADGAPLPNSVDLSIRVSRATGGTEIELERWRDGSREMLRIPLEARARAQLDISPLIVRRVEIQPGRRIEVETSSNGTDANQWIEEVVESVGESFSEATFIHQLEALRRERQGLLDKVRQMELRLEELEGELERLDSERR